MQDAIAALEKAGLLTRMFRNGHSTHYLITPASAAPPQEPHPAPTAPPPPQEPHLTPAGAAPRTVKEPSIEPSGAAPAVKTKRTAAKEKQLTFKQYIDQCNAAHVDYISESDPVLAYAKSIGLSRSFLELGWLAFWDRHWDATKKQASWPQTFRNYVERGWLGLWRRSEGEWVLTTAGLQLQLAEQAQSKAEHEQQLRPQDVPV